MACAVENTRLPDVLEYLLKDGLEGLGQAVTILCNEAMRIERSRHLKAVLYERCEDRIDYANGYKDKTLKTRIGALELRVPQVRDCNYYPSLLEKGLRSERALKLSIAQMYVQGVSTRKVTAILEQMCGLKVTSSEVSRASKLLDEELEKWRNRPIGCYGYLYIDARYEKIRIDGEVVDCAVLIASGVNKSGQRELLGVSVAASEQEVHWREFFESLQKRGLHGVELIISDAHSGMKAARKAVFPSIPWQRCQFHLQQNAQRHAPKQSMRKEIAADIRRIFNAVDKAEAERLLKLAVEKYSQRAPKLSEWMETSIPESLTVYSYSEAHWKKIRTSNKMERVNREVNRRTQVVGIFPNEASCLRLVTAVVIEITEAWSLENRYMPKEE